MKYQLSPILILFALVFVVSTTIGFCELKFAPIDEDFLEVGAYLRASHSPFSVSALFDPLPESVPRDAFQGTLSTRTGDSVNYVVFSSGSSLGVHDTLIFDVNGDGDLSNDKVYTGFSSETPKRIALTFPNGNVFSANVQTSSIGLFVAALEWYKGTVEIGGKRVDVAVIDKGNDGISSMGSNDVLLVDLNGNGRFDVQATTSTESEEFSLSTSILLGGALHSIVVDKEKPDINFVPYNGDKGSLDIALECAKEIKGFEGTAYVYGSNLNIQLNVSKESLPIGLPVGDFSSFVRLELVDENDQVTRLEVVTVKPLKIEKDKTTLLILGRAEPLEVKISQRGSRLIVGQKLADKRNVSYSVISPMPNGIAQTASPVGSNVKIFDAKHKLLSEGYMEYGCGGVCEYSWNIQTDIKAGDKLIVEITWETGSVFGTLKAMKEYVVQKPIPEVGAGAMAIGLDDQLRRKLALVESDLRTLALGMEAYFVDNDRYPEALYSVTTPVSYISEITFDPFNLKPDQTNPDIPYFISTDEKTNEWVIYSLGPDGKDDGGAIEYDPTNGVDSHGDILQKKF